MGKSTFLYRWPPYAVVFVFFLREVHKDGKEIMMLLALESEKIVE